MSAGGGQCAQVLLEQGWSIMALLQALTSLHFIVIYVEHIPASRHHLSPPCSPHPHSRPSGGVYYI